MNRTILPICFFLICLIPLSSSPAEPEGYTLHIVVRNLRNSKGHVQFVLYNRENSIPDEHFTRFYRKLSVKIDNGSSFATFNNLPEGKYAVKILHDENSNNRIDKGFIFPKEGIGFSNIKDISFANKPDFKRASFILNNDKELEVKIIYL